MISQFRFSAIVLATAVMATANVQAQGLAEDFSSDIFSLRVEPDNLGSPLDVITVGADGTSINLRATTNDADRGKFRFSSVQPQDVNELTITTMLSSDTQFNSAVEGQAKIEMDGYFYNDLQENGLGDENRTGDSSISLAIDFRNDGAAFGYACFERRNADGSRSIIPGTDSGNGDNCTGFTTAPAFDTLHTLTIGYNKAESKIYAVIDDERVEYDITTGHHTPQRAQTEFALRVRGTSTVAVGSFHSVNTNTYSIDDLSNYTGESPYKKPNSDDDISVLNGKLRLGAESDGSASDETNRSFRALGETNYLEAKIMLSSDSALDDTGYNVVRLRNTFYNEAQNGGTGNDGLGDATADVFATLNLFMSENREVMADLAIARADSGDFSTSTSLSNDPNVPWPVLKTGLSLDTEYLASIQLDDVANQLIFKIDDAEHVYDIQTPTFTASFVDGAGVDSRIRGAGETVAFADDFRTHPNAQTNEEQIANGGQTTGGESGGGSGGGGCSVGSAGSSTGFMFVMALLVSFLRLRRSITIFKR